MQSNVHYFFINMKLLSVIKIINFSVNKMITYVKIERQNAILFVPCFFYNQAGKLLLTKTSTGLDYCLLVTMPLNCVFLIICLHS